MDKYIYNKPINLLIVIILPLLLSIFIYIINSVATATD